MGKERRQPWALFSCMLLVSGKSSGMLKVTDGREEQSPLVLGTCSAPKKKMVLPGKRGAKSCMPRDWISSQEPWWELPDLGHI